MVPIDTAVSDKKILNIFPIESYAKIMSADGGHLGCTPGSSDTIPERDYLQTISTKAGPNMHSGVRGKLV